MASITDRRIKEPTKAWKLPWRLRWRDAAGNQHSEHHRTRKDAQVRAREVEEHIEQGMPIHKPKDTRKITVGVLADAFDANPRSVKQTRKPLSTSYLTSVRNHLKDIRRLLGDVAAFDLLQDPAHLENFERLLIKDRKIGTATVNRYLTTLSMLFTYGKQQRLTPITWPRLDISRHPEVKPVDGSHEYALNRRELQRLVDAAPETHTAFIWTAVATGLRLGELLALRCSDLRIGSSGHYIAVRQARDGDTVVNVKGPKTAAGIREVPIDPALSSFLHAHMTKTQRHRDKRPELGLVFPSRNGTMLSPQNFSRRTWPQVRRGARLADDLEFRHIRRSFGTLLLAATNDVALVAKLMGHEDIATTLNRYMRPIRGTDTKVSKTFIGLGPEAIRKVLKVSSQIKVDETGIHAVGADE